MTKVELKIIIPGKPITKKNSQRIFRKSNGTPFIVPSKKYKEYEEIAGYYIKCKGKMLCDPVCVRCEYFMPDRRHVDLCNLLEASCDILTRYRVIADDHSGIVASHDGSRVLVDRDNPRVEITITTMEEK